METRDRTTNDPVIGATQYIVELLGSQVTAQVQASSAGKVVSLSGTDITRSAPEICTRLQGMGLEAEFADGTFRISRPLLVKAVDECLDVYKTKGQWKDFLTSYRGLTDKDKSIVDSEVRNRLGKPPKTWPSR